MKSSSLQRFARNAVIRVHIFTDNPDKLAALTVLSVARCLCGQLTRTVFVWKRWTRAEGLIINTRVSVQTKVQHKGREMISEATQPDAALCSVLLTHTHTHTNNCRGLSQPLSRTNILYASGSHREGGAVGGWGPLQWVTR